MLIRCLLSAWCIIGGCVFLWEGRKDLKPSGVFITLTFSLGGVLAIWTCPL